VNSQSIILSFLEGINANTATGEIIKKMNTQLIDKKRK